MKKDSCVNYRLLIGKNKKEVVEELGQEFNYIPSDEWCYTLKKKNFLGLSEILLLFFKEGKVYKIEIKHKMQKIW